MEKSIQIPEPLIESKIYLIRGQKVMLDSDLAEMYGVETRVLKQAVRRNIERFPEDFMFELTKEETEHLLKEITLFKITICDLEQRTKHQAFAICIYGTWSIDVIKCFKKRTSCAGKHPNHACLL